jgi:hypothetical protein
MKPVLIDYPPLLPFLFFIFKILKRLLFLHFSWNAPDVVHIEGHIKRRLGIGRFDAVANVVKMDIQLSKRHLNNNNNNSKISSNKIVDATACRRFSKDQKSPKMLWRQDYADLINSSGTLVEPMALMRASTTSNSGRVTGLSAGHLEGEESSKT